MAVGNRSGQFAVVVAFHRFGVSRIDLVTRSERAPSHPGGERRGRGRGFGGDSGTRAVLEVRPHDVPFLVEDGQVFFKLLFFRTLEAPQIVYGDRRLDSHYQGQGLTLSKHFRAPVGAAQ